MMPHRAPDQGMHATELDTGTLERIGAAGQKQESGLISMDLDGDSLLLPQVEIESVESAAELAPPDEGTPLAGYLTYAGARWPVVCVDSDLEPLTPVPPGRRVCLLLKSRKRGFGVLCDGIRLLEAKDLRAQGMPPCMAVTSSPLAGLAIHRGKVFGVTSADTLGVFLEQWAQKEE